MRRVVAISCVLALVLVQVPPVWGASTRGGTEITVPIGTKVYCELDQRVVSKKKEFQVGDKIRVHVWRDVMVDGEIVVPAGSLVDAEVSRLKTSKIAGVKGKLELSANSVLLRDGREILLSGGYGKQGRGRVAVSVTLAALVAWPLIFIKGSKAELPPGTVFDAYTDQQFAVSVERPESIPTLHLANLVDAPLAVEVLYEELQGKKKVDALPMRVSVCSEVPASGLVIDRINGKPINHPMALSAGEFEPDGDCQAATATVPLKPLVKQFSKGINRFDVSYGAGESRVATEVILDIQV